MESFNPYLHHRKSIRLEEYDYSLEGLYFITICIHQYKSLLGDIQDDIITLNAAGKMIETEWLAIQNRFPTFQLHEYVVMPNHFHAIIQIVKPSTNSLQNSNTEKTKNLGDVIAAFKSITTVNYIHGVKNLGWSHFDSRFWQLNYWEHIIRKQESYQQIAEYINTNPAKWNKDKLNQK
jgi:putative transposase